MPGKKLNGSCIIKETVKHRLNDQYAPSFWGNLDIVEAPLTAASVVIAILGSHSDCYDLCINDRAHWTKNKSRAYQNISFPAHVYAEDRAEFVK